MKSAIIILTSCFMLNGALAQHSDLLRDEQGRHIIPRGFVINTENQKGDIYYTPDDYHRMVRMGANFQVIRLKLGRLGGYPGNEVEESYILHLDSLVQMGKNAGIKTDFKMTVYGTRGFSWDGFWRNENGEINHLISAWKSLWDRYRDEPAVFGYDLLNEPMKGGLDISYEKMESAYLVPLYIRLMDVCQQINPQKKILFQPLCIPISPDWKEYLPPFIRMQTPINRKNIIYAPHIYEGDPSRIPKWIERYQMDAAISGAPLFIGEWGAATFDRVDSSVTWQHHFIDFYIETVRIFDSLGLGSIKPWFTGTTAKYERPDWEGWDKEWWQAPYTWSIFKDNRNVGTVERKYITDIIARPYPQTIAGKIDSYRFDFPTRSLDVHLKTDNSKGASRIFIGADRHYPDGFSVICNDVFILYHNPLKNIGLEVLSTDRSSNPEDFIWNPDRQQLIILKWPEDKTDLHLTIEPGIRHDPPHGF